MNLYTIYDAEHADELKALVSRAQGEVSIREALRELEMWGASTNFSLTPYQDSSGRELSIIRDWKELVNQVGDNQCLLQSLKDSPYFESYADKASIWETRLAELDEYLHNLNQVQRRWVYLEPIFGRGALPNEQGRFKRVDTDFKVIMADIARDTRVVSLTSRQGIKQTIATLLDQLCRCQKALNEFLEVSTSTISCYTSNYHCFHTLLCRVIPLQEKRSVFPRFYFIGDDDLLEILGQSTNPSVIQSHLKKLFAGIYSVQFDEKNSKILAMLSLEREVVTLKNPVPLSLDVEVSSLEHCLNSSLPPFYFFPSLSSFF